MRMLLALAPLSLAREEFWFFRATPSGVRQKRTVVTREEAKEQGEEPRCRVL